MKKAFALLFLLPMTAIAANQSDLDKLPKKKITGDHSFRFENRFAAILLFHKMDLPCPVCRIIIRR